MSDILSTNSGFMIFPSIEKRLAFIERHEIEEYRNNREVYLYMCAVRDNSKYLITYSDANPVILPDLIDIAAEYGATLQPSKQYHP